MPPHTLVSDFDGTLTEVDFYYVARQHLIAPGPDYHAEYARGELSHFDLLARNYARIDKPEAEVVRRVRAIPVAPDLPKLVARLRDAGWGVVVASAGCRWYVDILLAGVDVPVYANPGSFEPGRGLVMRRDTASPFYCAEVGVDKSAVVRDALQRGGRVAYAGDGYTDAPALELVEPELRFARADAARALAAKGLGFRGFERWGEVAAALLAGSST